MSESLPRAGLVSPSSADSWLGGHYIVQSLFLATHALPPEHRPRFQDVWWGAAPPHDPFHEVRPLLGDRVVVGMPRTFTARAVRAIRRRLSRSSGAADLFRAAGIDVLFPVRPFDDVGIPFVFHLPDFQYRHLPNVNDERTGRWFDEYYRTQGGAAARIHLSSESVLRDLQTFMPELVPKARVVFPVSIPTATWWEVDPTEVRARYNLPQHYFVISNQVSAHKNHRTIARALSAVDAMVVCTGKAADYRDPSFFPTLEAEIRTLGVQDRFRFLGVLPRADQLAVIRGAVAAIQPSEFEGWGAAVAEAKTLGKPLLASDLPVHREHQHPFATYVDPYDVDAWAAAMRTAWRDLPSGPNLGAEEQARARTMEQAREVGRQFAALLTEAVRE